MRSRFGNSLRIGLSRTGIALVRTSGVLRPRHHLVSDTGLTEPELAPQPLAARLEALVAETGCAGLATTVILADEWARMFIVRPPDNAARLQDYRAAAAMRFQALYGEPLTDWWLEAGWDARHPFLACALPQALLMALRAAAATHRITVVQIVPQFVAAWNRARSTLKPDAWFGLVQAKTLTLGAIDGQRLCAVRAVAIPTGSTCDAQWVSEHVGREALLLGLPVPNRLQLCGPLARHWAVHSDQSLRCEHLDSRQPAVGTLPLSAAAVLAQTGIHQ